MYLAYFYIHFMKGMVKTKKRSDGRYSVSKVVNGKRIYAYGKTRELAVINLREKLNVKKVLRTFSEIADDWVKEKWDSFSYGTQNCYRSALDRAVELFGSTPCDQVTTLNIQKLLNNMNNYSQKTVKIQKSVISTIYRSAIIRGDCDSNPATYAVIPKGLKKEIREAPSDYDVEKIKKSKFLPALLMMYTGCRKGEALALCYEDIDFERNKVHINKEIIFNSNIPVLVHRTKTEAGKRSVPLLNILKEQLDINGHGKILGDYTLTQFRTLWEKYQREMNFTVTAHQLRHQYATMLYEAKVDVKTAQKLLGHSSIKMTQDVYTHIKENRIDDVTEQLNNFLN